MAELAGYLKQRHIDCDECFAQAEQMAAEAKWPAAGQQWQEFLRQCESHFRQEEQVLFPLLERYLGASGGPTAVMRIEHQQIRGLNERLTAALEARDPDEFLGGTETLLVLLQQHNTKEEQILYNMADRLLGRDHAAVIQALEEAAH